MSATRTREGARDFDFWMGSWKVHNRYLRERLKGSNDWLEFDATSEARPLSDVLGNQDEFRTEHDGGFVGMSFRFFDPDDRAVGDLLGGQPAAGSARSARVRLLLRRRRHLRGQGHLRGHAHPRAVRLVGNHHADARAGSRRSRRTAARRGRPTGSWISRRSTAEFPGLDSGDERLRPLQPCELGGLGRSALD